MKIAITGDLFLEHPDTIVVDSEIKSMMSGFDYRIVNLEGALYSDNQLVARKKSGPSLKQPESVVRILEELGADMLTLSNNHVMDFGVEGYHFTKKILSNRYELLGCGNWEEAYAIHIVEKEGLKVGFLNGSEMQFGMLHDSWTQPFDTIGCAWINHPRFDELIKKSRSMVDRLVLICHAGVEMMNVPLPEWRTRYRQLVDLGCDAIIAHHPHVVQGFEIYKGAPICYSLGNFCFVRDGSSNAVNWNTGGVAILEVKRDGVQLKTAGVRTLNRTKLTLLQQDVWIDYINNLNNMLSADNYVECVNKECLKQLDDYYYILSMGGLIRFDKHWMKSIARLLLHKYDIVHLLNNFQCESHRWCISRALRLQDKGIA